MKLADALPGVAAGMKVEPTTAPPVEPLTAPYKVQVLQDPVVSDPARYIVTSERFTGKAELVYMDGVLQDVKLMETNMKPAQRQSFKSLVPVLESQLPEFWKHTSVAMVKTEYEVPFDQFWNDYHKTLGVPKEHKDRTLKEWSLLDATERLKAWLYIKEYHAFLQLPRNKGRGIKNADTYLKAKPWKNE